MATHRPLNELLGVVPRQAPPPETPSPETPSQQVASPDTPSQQSSSQLAGSPEAPAQHPSSMTLPQQATAQQTPSAEAATQETPAPQRDPAVRTPEPGTTERVTLYLHPDDYRALGVAKLDDKVDHNTRLRAMIALWREDPGLRARIDDLATRTRGRS